MAVTSMPKSSVAGQLARIARILKHVESGRNDMPEGAMYSHDPFGEVTLMLQKEACTEEVQAEAKRVVTFMVNRWVASLRELQKAGLLPAKTLYAAGFASGFRSHRSSQELVGTAQMQEHLGIGQVLFRLGGGIDELSDCLSFNLNKPGWAKGVFELSGVAVLAHLCIKCLNMFSIPMSNATTQQVLMEYKKHGKTNKLWLDPAYGKDAMMTFFVQHNTLFPSTIHMTPLSDIWGYCGQNHCASRCKHCGESKMTPVWNGEWESMFLMFLCDTCSSVSLVKVKPPTFNQRVARGYTARFRQFSQMPIEHGKE